jgi:hypothetical protein
MAIKQIFNTSAELDYPTVLPTLDLDFANSKTLDPRITFTRSSGGSYVGADGLIKYAGVNEARFDHNPVTLESLGLLVEEARTNLITYSEQFDNASWFGNANVTSNTDTAPDGNLTADTYSSSGNQIATNFVPISQNTNYTASLYIKKTTGRDYTAGFYLNYDAGTNYQILFNTNDGTFSPITGGTVPTTRVDNAGSYWRVSLTANSGSTTNVRFFLYPNLNVNGAIATGQQVIWGAQLEAGTFPTSYIPTVASTRTRATEFVSITGTNFSSWYRQDEGTFSATILLNPVDVGGRAGSVFSLKSGDRRLNGFTAVFSDTTSRYKQLSVDAYDASGARTAVVSGPVVRSKNLVKLAVFYSPGLIGGITDEDAGVMTAPDSGTRAPTQMLIGINVDSIAAAVRPNGTIARLTYYPVRLPDATLKAITT